MKLKVLLVAAAIAAGTAPAHGAPTALPLVEGPDVPPITEPVAVLDVFVDERFDGCAGKVAATKTIDVPDVNVDRVVLDFTGVPVGDPWDRLFRVVIGGVEVLRGTTPRTTFHLRRDITEYASLLPAGASTQVTLELGSYVGAQSGSLAIELYQDEPTAALVRAPASRVVGALDGAGLMGNGKVVGADVDFGDAVASRAIVDLTLSNHGAEEALFANRVFHILVDGREIATARPMPYTYAILGFGAANANSACTGPATSSTGDTVHPVMWWTAQQAADVAGVHTGVGEIPPYRAEVDAADLALLTGARRVEVVQQTGNAVWITSLAFLIS